MGNINLSWSNTGVAGNLNATAFRVQKRIKAVGGAWDTSGFTPVNDMPTSTLAAVAAVTDNRVYEFKVDTICSLSGPTPNTNGLIDQIVFACFNPAFVVTFNKVTVNFDLTNRDITKINVTLRKQSDSTVVATQTVVNTGVSASAVFTGLTAATGYYVDFALYTILNGIEVVSSSVDPLNARCGSNSAGFQATTSAAPSAVPIAGAASGAEEEVCTNPFTFYIASPDTDITIGTQIYADSGLTTPLTGYNFAKGLAGNIYNINAGTGIVGSLTGNSCNNLIVQNGFTEGGNTIVDVTGFSFTPTIGTFPVPGFTSLKGVHTGFAGAITVEVDLGTAPSGKLILYKNSIQQECIPVPINDTYTFAAVTFAEADQCWIQFYNTPC